MENTFYEIISDKSSSVKSNNNNNKNGMHMREEQYVQSKTWLDPQGGKYCQ